jgi:hypothetical protein
MSNKMWDSLVEHAKTCVLSGKHYVYYARDSRNVGAIFNNIYEFTGLIADDQFISAENLTDNQKVSVLCDPTNHNALSQKPLQICIVSSV